MNLKCPRCNAKLSKESHSNHIGKIVVYTVYRLVCLECSFTTRTYLHLGHAIRAFKMTNWKKKFWRVK